MAVIMTQITVVTCTIAPFVAGGAEIGAGNEINGLPWVALVGTNFELCEVYANLDDGIEFFEALLTCGGWLWHSAAMIPMTGIRASVAKVSSGLLCRMQPPEAIGGGEWMVQLLMEPALFQPYHLQCHFQAQVPTVLPKSGTAMLMRDATGGTVANSIFTSFVNHAIEVEDLPSASVLTVVSVWKTAI